MSWGRPHCGGVKPIRVLDHWLTNRIATTNDNGNMMYWHSAGILPEGCRARPFAGQTSGVSPPARTCRRTRRRSSARPAPVIWSVAHRGFAAVDYRLAGRQKLTALKTTWSVTASVSVGLGSNAKRVPYSNRKGHNEH